MSPIVAEDRRGRKRRAGDVQMSPKSILLDSGKILKIGLVRDKSFDVTLDENSVPVTCNPTPSTHSNNHVICRRGGSTKVKFSINVKVKEMPSRRMLRSRFAIPDDSTYPTYYNQLKGIDQESLDSSHLVDEYDKQDQAGSLEANTQVPGKSILKPRCEEEEKLCPEEEGPLFDLNTTEEEEEDMVFDYVTALEEAIDLANVELQEYQEAGEGDTISTVEVTEPSHDTFAVEVTEPSHDTLAVIEETEGSVPAMDESHVQESTMEEIRGEELDFIIPASESLLREEVVFPELKSLPSISSEQEEVEVPESGSLPSVPPPLEVIEVEEEDQVSQLPTSSSSCLSSTIVFQELVRVSSTPVGVSITMQFAPDRVSRPVEQDVIPEPNPVHDLFLPYPSNRDLSLGTNVQEVSTPPPEIPEDEDDLSPGRNELGEGGQSPSVDSSGGPGSSFWPLRYVYNLWTAAKRRLTI